MLKTQIYQQSLKQTNQYGLISKKLQEFQEEEKLNNDFEKAARKRLEQQLQLLKQIATDDKKNQHLEDQNVLLRDELNKLKAQYASLQKKREEQKALELKEQQKLLEEQKRQQQLKQQQEEQIKLQQQAQEQQNAGQVAPQTEQAQKAEQAQKIDQQQPQQTAQPVQQSEQPKPKFSFKSGEDQQKSFQKVDPSQSVVAKFGFTNVSGFNAGSKAGNSFGSAPQAKMDFGAAAQKPQVTVNNFMKSSGENKFMSLFTQ